MPPNWIVLIPAHNEEKQIANIVRQASAHLPVLVVDDGSSDQTAALAEEAGAQVIRQSPNQGKGVALNTGFAWALQQGYEAVLTLDGDGQHDPAEIPKFLAAGAQGADLIIGVRDFSQMPLVRKAANSLGTILLSWALGQQVPDNQSGYRLIGKRVMQAMLASREVGFEFEVEMIVLAIQRGFTIGWVPIRTIYEGGASHIQPLKHLVNFIRKALWTRQQIRKNAADEGVE